MVGIVNTYKDTWDTYNTNHMHKGLSIEEKKSEVRIKIQNQHTEMHITKDMGMVNNIDSIHEKIWGECTYPLQNMTKHLGKFTMKHKDKDVIWLLKELKTFSTEI